MTTDKTTHPRRFMMLRQVDETGVSGVGHIADGVVFPDGTTVVRWRTATPGTTSFASLDHAKSVHGHDGKTHFTFHDDEDLVWLCCMCFSDMDVPVNHCFQCGSGSSAIPMSKGQLEQVQRHDKQRLESLDEKDKELRALRKHAYDTIGAVELGLIAERRDDGSISGIRQEGSRTTYCVQGEPNEAVGVYFARACESVALNPAKVRQASRRMVSGSGAVE